MNTNNSTYFFFYIASSIITKTCLYNFDPLKPHFYIVKLGFTGIYIIFLISVQKHRLWVLIRTASARRFLSENFRFLEVKFSIYLNRRVFVMIEVPNVAYSVSKVPIPDNVL